MCAIFEQPKPLSEFRYHCITRALRPVFILYGVVLSGQVLIALWRSTQAGTQVSIANWILGAAVGLFAVWLHRLALRLEMSRRRYLEFQDDGLFLTGRGVVAFRRLLGWSLTPDSIDPRYTRVQLRYKFGFGSQRWTMLLDDPAQISELRQRLASQVPDHETKKDDDGKTAGQRRIVQLGAAMVAYFTWFTVVMYSSVHGFTAFLEWMKQSQAVRQWIAQSSIAAMLGPVGTLQIWFGTTLVLLALPAVLLRNYLTRIPNP